MSSSWARARSSTSRGRKTSISVRDYGRGIPLGKVIDCVSKVNTGGKFNDDVFQFSVGLNGIGTKAVNALSAEFEVVSYRDGKFMQGLFREGKLISQKEGKDPKAKTGTLVRFTPDPKIFTAYEWNDEFILKRLRYYAYLNCGPALPLQRRDGREPGGAARSARWKRSVRSPCITRLPITRARSLEFAFTHTANYRGELLQLRERPVHRGRRDASDRFPPGGAQGNR